MFSGKTLDYFIQLTESMSYTKAAEKLGISQPALTQRIKKFEKAIGAPLFYFKGKEMHLTQTGHSMLRAAQAVYTIFQNVAEEIECSTVEMEDHIKIGMLMSIEDQYFIDFLASYYAENQKSKISLHIFSREEIWNQLENEQIDIALLYLPDVTIKDWTAYESKTILSEELFYFQHSEANVYKEKVSLKETIDTRWAAYLPNLYINDLLRYAFIDQNLNLPSVAGYFSTPSQVMRFSSQTNCSTALPGTFIQANLGKENPYIAPFDPPIRYSLAFVYRKEKMIVPCIKRFLDYFERFSKKRMTTLD